MRRYEISDENWERIAPSAPRQSNLIQAGPLKTIDASSMPCFGSPAAEPLGVTCPNDLAPGAPFIGRFNRWSQKGIWQNVFEAMQDPDLEWLMVDSTSVRAHQQAAGQKKHP